MEMASDGSLASNAWAIDSVVAGRKEDLAAARTKFCKKRHFVNGEKPENQLLVHYYQLLSGNIISIIQLFHQSPQKNQMFLPVKTIILNLQNRQDKIVRGGEAGQIPFDDLGRHGTNKHMGLHHDMFNQYRETTEM